MHKIITLPIKMKESNDNYKHKHTVPFCPGPNEAYTERQPKWDNKNNKGRREGRLTQFDVSWSTLALEITSVYSILYPTQELTCFLVRY